MADSGAQPALSISIVTYRVDRREFARVLQSLETALLTFQEEEKGSVDIVIIDNGGQENLLREMADLLDVAGARIRVIGGQGNIGYGRAHNLAINDTRAAHHLILNPDVLLAPDALVTGVRYLRAHPNVCAVAPHALDGRGRVQYLCKRFPTVWDLFLRGFAPGALRRAFRARLSRYEMREMVDSGQSGPVPLLSGCCMLCDTQALQAVRGFNECFFLYFEDYALSMELAKRGELVFLPAMRIRHFGGNSARKGLRHILLFVQSGIKFFNAYGWRII